MKKKNNLDFLAEALKKHGVKILDKNYGSYLKLGSYPYVVVDVEDKFLEELADLVQDWNWTVLSRDSFYGGFRIIKEKDGYKIAPIIALLRYSKEFLLRHSPMAHIFSFFPPLFFLSLFFYRKSCGNLANFLNREDPQGFWTFESEK